MIRCVNCGMPLAPYADPDAPANTVRWAGWYHGSSLGVFCPPKINIETGALTYGAAKAPDGATFEDYFTDFEP